MVHFENKNPFNSLYPQRFYFPSSFSDDGFWVSNSILICGVLVSSNCPLRMLMMNAPKNATANKRLNNTNNIITDMA
jgi:hypothetical protein